MKTLSNILGKAISGALFFFLSVLIAVTFFQVLSRFVLKIPAVWTEEVARTSFVWLIFLGAAIGVKEGTHLVLDMLTTALGPKIRRYMQIGVLVMIVILSGVIFYAGADYCRRNRGKTLVTLDLPRNTISGVIPLSALLMLFFGVEKITDQIRGGKEDE